MSIFQQFLLASQSEQTGEVCWEVEKCAGTFITAVQIWPTVDLVLAVEIPLARAHALRSEMI